MSIDDQIEALVPPPSAPARLVGAGEKQILTLNRETDARTAVTRGLAEYLRGLSITAEGGRLCRFVEVFENWAEPEEVAKYPSAVIYATEGGTYDASTLTPKTLEVPGTTQYIREISELMQPLMLEVWSTDPMERMALVAMLEDALDPHEYMTGLRLALPHYHNQRATFEKMNMTYDDSIELAQRRWRRAIFSLNANVTQLRVVGTIPKLNARLDLQVAEGVKLSSGEVVDLQDC